MNRESKRIKFIPIVPSSRRGKRRLLIDLLLVAVVFGGYFWYTHWTPAHKIESEHYEALSNASIEDTQDALDKADTKIVSIKSIVNDEKPLKMDRHVNLYYIHWFSLVHFLLEGEQRKYREAFIACVKRPSGLKAFEKDIGPYQLIEQQWYQHLLQMTRETEY